MHKMMCMLKSRRLKERTLRVAYRRGLIRDNYDEAVAMVERALSDPKTAPWFDDRNKVCNERSIAIKDEEGKCVYRRPDRIIRTPEGKTVLIDYKFGHNNRSKEKYIKQGATWFAGECWNDEYDISARQLTAEEERDYQELWGG